MSPLAPLLLPILLSPRAAPDALVATHYFYWYRWPDSHFSQPGAPGPEGHLRRFPAPETVDWGSAAWHETQFRAMAAAGIDVALPVYWGAPGAYDRPGTCFSVEGLAPMAAALDAIAAAGETGVRLGMFYDTTTLLRSVRGLASGPGMPERPDLTAPEGKALFCGTVVEYFARVPERHWARLDSRPLVVTYGSGFAGAWDATLGPALRAAFAARFPGEAPFLVADATWGEIGQDLTTAWGAALVGPQLFPGVAQIGPGYDDSCVPSRHTPVRAREDGAFYRWSWRQAVVAKPRLVLIETWNEMHEGTEICATIETGRFYLELTREWTRRLAAGDPGPELPPPAPLYHRPDLAWGAEAKDAAEVRADYSRSSVERLGLREVVWEDGPCAVADGALRPRPVAAESVTYLYFQVSDHWRFDIAADLELAVTIDGAGEGELGVQYDSRDPAAPLDGAYAAAVLHSSIREGAATTLVYRLPGARLANRQNGGADLRLVTRGGGLAVGAVRLR
ncbi:MAG: hypothetical protein AB1726_05480 [Planctomycetota bacterium]